MNIMFLKIFRGLANYALVSLKRVKISLEAVWEKNLIFFNLCFQATDQNFLSHSDSKILWSKVSQEGMHRC